MIVTLETLQKREKWSFINVIYMNWCHFVKIRTQNRVVRKVPVPVDPDRLTLDFGPHLIASP